MRISLTFFILLFFAGQLFAQEQFYSLEFNATIKQLEKNHLQLKSSDNYKDTIDIALPFFDDFSEISGWPLPGRWADNYAFINTDYAVKAPTIGVATLDAIDEHGALYSNAGPFQFEADRLTSQSIRLDSLFSPFPRPISRSDSVYLSFYYQPQGRGSAPSIKDSLLLEFHSPVEFDTIRSATDTTIAPRWHTVWSSAGGIQVDTFAIREHGYFKEVLVPITDSVTYFKKGFRFRFRNYASLANNYVPDWQSNGDQWNIDLVYLNAGRSIHDTTIEDVAFADRAPSLLKNYESMPYKQYRENFVSEMKDTLNISISNLDKNMQNVSYKYYVNRDSQQAKIHSYDGGNYSLSSYSTTGYTPYRPFARPPVNFLYPPFENQEAIVFHSTHVLTTDASMTYKGNDTIRFQQIFSNYYAYDDGTAEAGIGLNGASGSYAVRFELNLEDTLRGIQIYFNQIKSGSTDRYIDLTVWNNSLAKPGQIIKQMADVTPLYSDSLNVFHTYWFDEPLVITAADFPGLIFYIGWQQSSIDNLNVGLDRYNDSHQNRFYNVDGTWQMSDAMHSGSVMMRPVVGSRNPLGTPVSTEKASLQIFPNPVSDGTFHIILPSAWKSINSNALFVEVYNCAGQTILNQNYTETVLLPNMPSGLYIVKVTNQQSGVSIQEKLLVH